MVDQAEAAPDPVEAAIENLIEAYRLALCKEDGKNPDFFDLGGPVCLVADARRTHIRPAKICLVSGGLVPNERHQKALLAVAAQAGDVVIAIPQKILDGIEQIAQAAEAKPEPPSP